MAVDAFLWFDGPKDYLPLGETQDQKFKDKSAFEIKDFSFNIENTPNIGSSSGGIGAGKAKFNEFTIKKPTDKSSPTFLQALGAGIHYDYVYIAIRKAGSDPKSSGGAYLIFTFATVFITKIDWSGPGDEWPEESISFVYGQFGINY